MELQAIERVQTQGVRDVLWAYREFYYLNENCLYRTCTCELADGEWPDIRAKDGTPVICEAHTWKDLQRALQREIVSSGLSMPIPRKLGKPDRKGQARLKEHLGPTVYKHPLLSEPQIIEVAKGTIPASQGAAWIARWLSSTENGEEKHRMEHVVFYVHHSQALNFVYERRNQAIEDVLLWAPVLVYFHNRDGRENGRTLPLIQSRQYGLAFIVEE